LGLRAEALAIKIADHHSMALVTKYFHRKVFHGRGKRARFMMRVNN